MTLINKTAALVPVRLRRPQAEVIAAGLALTEPQYHKAFAAGCRPNRGQYDATMMATIRKVRRELQERLETGSSSWRMHYTGIELAACAFGARLGTKAIRRGIVAEPAGASPRSRHRLLVRLENLRKTAKRASTRQGKEDYRQLQGRWRDHTAWLRVQLEGHAINTPAHQARRRYRFYLDTATDLTKRQLQLEGVPLPPDRELRAHVRAGLQQMRQNMRRLCGQATMKDVIDRNHRASAYLGKFVRRRLERTACSQTPTQRTLVRFPSHEDPFHNPPQGTEEPHHAAPSPAPPAQLEQL